MYMVRFSAPDLARRYSATEVRALIEAQPKEDGTRYELIDGELLVSPAPRLVHQRGVALLYRALDIYVRREGIGEALFSPADLELERGNITQPDAFVMPLVNGARVRQWTEVGALLVAAEVLSPSTARFDRLKKRRYYLRNETPEYWIVDLDARVIERWRPDDLFRPEVLDGTLVWHPAGAATAFVLDLPAYFAEAQGETGTTA